MKTNPTTLELHILLSHIVDPIADLANDDNLDPGIRGKLVEIRATAIRMQELINGIAAENAIRSQPEEDLISKFRKIVEDNLEVRDLDIPFLADKLCMSHSTLYRKIKVSTGLTPNELIRKVRLEKACKLLSEKTSSVSDISYSTGFSNPAYFRRVFRSEFGVSPSAFAGRRAVSNQDCVSHLRGGVIKAFRRLWHSLHQRPAVMYDKI